MKKMKIKMYRRVIIITNQKKLMTELVEGSFKFNGLNECVITDSLQETYNISDFEAITGAFSGDTVLYDKCSKTVKKIIKRSGLNIPGVLNLSSKTVFGFTKNNVPLKKFVPVDRKIPPLVVSTKRQYQPSDVYAIVKFKEWVDKVPHGTLETIIGDVGDYETEMTFLRDRYGVRWKKFKSKIEKFIDLTPQRVDLTDRDVCSVDPESCEDVDDALHYKEFDDYIELGVHIADVSSYIPEDSELDLEARMRGETIYLKHEQYNMLPDNLAVNECSLLQNVKKRAFSVIYHLEKNSFEIKEIKFMKSFIVNKRKLSYEVAQKELSDLYTVGKIWYQRKFSQTENYDTHKMVEIFMLKTNIVVAKYISEKMPDHSILRVQKGYKVDKIKDTDKLLKSIIEKVNHYRLEGAEYIVGNQAGRHELIDEEYYTHFTSPIRRYVDIMVHRLLYLCMNSGKIEKKEIEYRKICNYINDNHKIVKKAERESYLLDVIYFDIPDDLILETDGYIIKITDNSLLFHVPELKIDAECRLIPERIKHLVKYESSQDKIKLLDYIELKLLDKVKIRIVVSIKATSIRKKLLVQIIDPEISFII